MCAPPGSHVHIRLVLLNLQYEPIMNTKNQTFTVFFDAFFFLFQDLAPPLPTMQFQRQLFVLGDEVRDTEVYQFSHFMPFYSFIYFTTDEVLLTKN